MRRTFLLVFLAFFPSFAQAEPLRIGYIGSLTGFAASYGTAVLDGVKLAEEIANREGKKIELFVEDDQSSPKETATAYQKLRSVNKIEVLITGTWWANAIVQTVERDAIPFLSCETLYNKETVFAPNFFTMHGDLREWVRVFEPLVERRHWKTGAIVRFVSGFADTLAEEMNSLFSKPGRTFLKDTVYSDFDMAEAATIATQTKSLAPQVLYIDGQPAGISKLINRLAEQQASGLVIFSNSNIGDAVRQGLLDPEKFPGEIFYSKRQEFKEDFQAKFTKKFSRPPVLDADLGYYSLLLVLEAAKIASSPAEGKSLVAALKSGKLSVDGTPFVFDGQNVYRGLAEQLFFYVGKDEKNWR